MSDVPNQSPDEQGLTPPTSETPPVEKNTDESVTDPVASETAGAPSVQTPASDDHSSDDSPVTKQK